MKAHSAHQSSTWAFVPAGLMVLMVGGLLTMAAIAGSDPAFALEPDYYAKAVRWDEEQAQQATNARLGWRLDATIEPRNLASGTTRLLVRLTDGSHQPVTGASLKLEAFANARAAERVRTELRENADGGYFADLKLEHSGLWELRFSAARGSERFTHRLRLDLTRSSK